MNKKKVNLYLLILLLLLSNFPYVTYAQSSDVENEDGNQSNFYEVDSETNSDFSEPELKNDKQELNEQNSTEVTKEEENNSSIIKENDEINSVNLENEENNSSIINEDNEVNSIDLENEDEELENNGDNNDISPKENSELNKKQFKVTKESS
ncbi:hypothetical protein, partial [Oceanobacillus kimchii]